MIMFYTRNNKARKYFVGRRLEEGKKGINIYYSLPITDKEKKKSILTFVKHNGNHKTRIDLSGRDVFQLKRILKQAKTLKTIKY
jgi:hypothetical protein